MAVADDTPGAEQTNVTPEVIVLIMCVIAGVQSQIRALRDLALENHDKSRWNEDFTALVQFVCERMHMSLDDCMIELGEEWYDNYRNAITEVRKRREIG
jgi:hypothetical protein